MNVMTSSSEHPDQFPSAIYWLTPVLHPPPSLEVRVPVRRYGETKSTTSSSCSNQRDGNSPLLCLDLWEVHGRPGEMDSSGETPRADYYTWLPFSPHSRSGSTYGKAGMHIGGGGDFPTPFMVDVTLSISDLCNWKTQNPPFS